MPRKPHLFKQNGIWYCASGRAFPASTAGNNASLAYTRWKWGYATSGAWEVMQGAPTTGKLIRSQI